MGKFEPFEAFGYGLFFGAALMALIAGWLFGLWP